MKKTKKLIINALIMTGASLAMRMIHVSFQSYLSRKIGAAGIGLFQLIVSVNTLAVVFSLSGIKLSAVRLVAEESGRKNYFGVKKSMRSCFLYSIICSSVTAVVMFAASELICTKWLGDIRALTSLRLLALSLPVTALSSVIGSYFTAIGRIGKYIVIGIFENIFSIILTVLILSYVPANSVEHGCLSVIMGTGIASVIAFAFCIYIYLKDQKQFPTDSRNSKKTSVAARMLRIALPVAVSDYLRTALNTASNLLIPKGLKKYGSNEEQALGSFGIITGMVFPVIMLPASLIFSIAELTVPTLAEYRIRNDEEKITGIVNKLIKFTLFFSACAFVIIHSFAEEIGMLLYSNSSAAGFIKIFSPMLIIIYMDSVTDGILKGLGEEAACMHYNIVASVLNIILIYTMIPLFGITGYIITYATVRLINFFFSYRKLLQTTSHSISIKTLLRTILCSVITVLFANHVLGIFSGHLLFKIIASAIIYISFLFLSFELTQDDIIKLHKLIK